MNAFDVYHHCSYNALRLTTRKRAAGELGRYATKGK
jgi:hypothetical protein